LINYNKADEAQLNVMNRVFNDSSDRHYATQHISLDTKYVILNFFFSSAQNKKNKNTTPPIYSACCICSTTFPRVAILNSCYLFFFVRPL